MAAIVVHHLENSRSQRILWLLEELGLEYSVEEYKRNPKTMRAGPELRKIHPLGRSPVVTVDDTVLAESAAIIEELIERFGEGRLRPEHGTDDYRRYRFYLHYAEGSLMTPLFAQLLTSQVRAAKLPFFIKPIAKGVAAKIDKNYTTPELANHLGFLDSELKDREYMAGSEFSAADIQMSYPLEAGVGANTRYSNIKSYIERIRDREAYKRVVDKWGALHKTR
jgi:glutathione S-transferase